MTFHRNSVILEYEGRGADFISKKPDMSGMVEGFGKESLPKENAPAEEENILNIFFWAYSE